jgi:hypothetical protein
VKLAHCSWVPPSIPSFLQSSTSLEERVRVADKREQAGKLCMHVDMCSLCAHVHACVSVHVPADMYVHMCQWRCMCVGVGVHMEWALEETEQLPHTAFTHGHHCLQCGPHCSL